MLAAERAPSRNRVRAGMALAARRPAAIVRPGAVHVVSIAVAVEVRAGSVALVDALRAAASLEDDFGRTRRRVEDVLFAEHVRRLSMTLGAVVGGVRQLHAVRSVRAK